MTADELFETLKAKIPGAEKHATQIKTYLTVKVAPGDLLAAVKVLKEDLGFQYLDMVTAVDWKGPVDIKGFISDPNPNFFLPEGAVGAEEEPPKAAPGFPYRDAFEVVYLLSNLDEKLKLFVRTEVPRAEPRVPSLTGLYRAAEWQEREAYDLLGVIFEGHPNLKKILTPDFIAGHPLRKDYVHQKDLYD